ncbi:RNA polymerase sigma factor [Cellulomonas sp.]|uniref:RNA polymerase sigma factor n=1 Tax=Cellulomonas sp. TaxID=40001 RepID=UPI002587DD49|nr:RNA polymerase sigma factor [Cellulomonas sp.]MCR6688730.1 RNA polymerase sigma factor [Cellulomonas sp.]
MSDDETPDARRFSELWDRYAPRIQAYALRHVDRDEAPEILAETFLVAWRRLVDVPGEPLPWLLVVARNTIANHHRSRHRARVLADELMRLQLVAAPGPSPADGVAERDAQLRALAALTTTEREALLLVAWDGLAPAQAALVAGCSTSAFKVRLHRARRRLDSTLQQGDLDERAAGPASTPPSDAALSLVPQEG